MTFRTTIPYSKHWATGRLDAKLQSVSFCWSTVGTTVSLAFSHKAMLKKSFNQIQKITIQGLWVQKHAFEFFLKIVRLCVGCWPVTVMALLQAFLTKQGQIEDKPSFLMFSTKKKKNQWRHFGNHTIWLSHSLGGGIAVLTHFLVQSDWRQHLSPRAHVLSESQPGVDAHPGIGFSAGHSPGLVPENKPSITVFQIDFYSRPLAVTARLCYILSDSLTTAILRHYATFWHTLLPRSSEKQLLKFKLFAAIIMGEATALHTELPPRHK